MPSHLERRRCDDPMKLRELLMRAAGLAREHALQSTVVGMAGPEGEVMFPEIVDFIESGLRVEDAVFRMTRERAVLVLADADAERAREITDRLLHGFLAQFPTAREPDIALGFYEVPPDTTQLTVKEVLPSIFAGRAPIS